MGRQMGLKAVSNNGGGTGGGGVTTLNGLAGSITLTSSNITITPSGSTIDLEASSLAFSAITSGTNTNQLVVGTAGKLTYTGTGIINATGCLMPAANSVRGYVSQNFYVGAILSNTLSTQIGAANRWDMSPIIFAADLTIDQIGIDCSTPVASALAKITVYDSDTSGNPNNLLHETADFDMSTGGYKSESWSNTFTAGVRYHFGLRSSSTAATHALSIPSMASLGAASNTSQSMFNCYRRTLTYATGATTPYVFTAADLAAGIQAPAVKVRAL